MGAFLAMLVALSLRARSRQVFTDPTSAMLWNVAFYAAALGYLLLVLWLAWRAPVRPADVWRRLGAAARGSLPAMRRQWERAVTGGWPGISSQVWHWLQPMVGQLLAVLALAMIAASLVDIFYVGWLPQAGALVVLAMAWTCLAEVTAQGPLRAFVVNVVPEVYERLANQGSWLRQAWLLLSGQLAGPLSQLGTGLRRLVSLRPFPEALMKPACCSSRSWSPTRSLTRARQSFSPSRPWLSTSRRTRWRSPRCRFRPTSAARSSITSSTRSAP
jgi:hypothetical protein